MGLIRQITKSLMTYVVPRRRMLTCGPGTSSDMAPTLALTFDDGPHPEHTPRLLDVLARHQLRATFYVIGREAERHPHLIRRIADEGHELGNHTWSHSEPSRTSAQMFLDEITCTDQLLFQLTGRLTTSVRPPKGELSFKKFVGLWQRKKAVALWNVDPRDYRMSSADDMVAWCSAWQPHSGDIVLLHDNHPWAITAVSTMAARGIFTQFQTTRISDWIGCSNTATTNQATPIGNA